MASLSEVEAILITAVVAAILTAWGVVTQRVVTRRLTTIQHLSAKDADKDVIEARKKFNELSDPTGKLSTYTKPDDLSEEESNSVRLILNDYEVMAIGVENGIFDLAIIKHYGRGTILRDWARTAPFIHKLRNELDNPYVYYEFEHLAHWLQEERKPKRRIWTKLWF